MARRGKVDFRDLEAFAKKVEDNLDETRTKAFMEACAKELAARLLRKVIKRTPVGKSRNGVKGGTLRRGWTGETGQNANSYVSSLNITSSSGLYVIEIVNPVHYASYVEYGHRTRNHKGWVNGRFMMTISAEEVENLAPALLEKKLQTLLGEVFG